MNATTLALAPSATLTALLALAVGVGALATPYMGAATFAYLLMVWGLALRKKNRLAHRRLMFSAMGIDLSLVLILEIQRSAIDTVVGLQLEALPFAHVVSSTLALVLYLPLILMGKKLWDSPNPRLQLWHKRVGITAFALRTLGFLLMFSLLGRAA